MFIKVSIERQQSDPTLGGKISVVNSGNRDMLVSGMGLEYIEYYEQFKKLIKENSDNLRFLFIP